MNQEPSEGRIPPYDMVAEHAVLGAVLLDNDAWKTVRRMVQAEDFYNHAHRLIYRAISQLMDAGTQVDHVTLAGQLDRNGDLERVGGAIALSTLTDNAAVASSVRHHAQIVIDAAAVRRMIYAAQEIVAQGFGYKRDAVEFLSGARRSIIRAAQYADLSRGGPQPLDADYRAIYKTLEERTPPRGLVRTGIPCIDEVTGGLWPELTLVAARPGMGKSCLVQNISTNVALHGGRVCHVTLEDTRDTVAIRNMARFSGVDAQRLRMNQVHPDEYTPLLHAIARLSNLPLVVEDTTKLSVDNIAQIAAAEHDRNGLDLLIVDLLTEIKKEGENEYTRFTYAAQGLRDIAKEMNIPVVVVTQLNREVEREPDKRPQLRHLRNSGELEAIARSVWFLWRAGYYGTDDDAKFRRDAELRIAKSNHGRTGLVRLYTDLSCMYVRGWDHTQDGPWPGDVEVYSVPDHFRQPARGAIAEQESFVAGDDY